MTALTPERRADLRDMVATSGTYSTCIPGRDLRALLDAADDVDRLAAAVERVRALVKGDDTRLMIGSDGIVSEVVDIDAILYTLEDGTDE